MPTGIKIFISYAHENKALRNELEEKLAPLGRTGLVFIWSDQNLNPGVLWANEIKTQLHSAEVILLLITPEFMNSLY
ncbi:MAG: toll/interleukin-1 receptor domain-containing protein [Ktedonobacteraceae bacterium]